MSVCSSQPFILAEGALEKERRLIPRSEPSELSPSFIDEYSFLLVHEDEQLPQVKPKPLRIPGFKPHLSPSRCMITQQPITPVQENRVFVVKCSWPTQAKRKLEPALYQACAGQFGTPLHIVSFEACHKDKAPISNSIFLPPDAQSGKVWKVWGNKSSDPTDPDMRSLWVSVLADEGCSLETCTEAWDLCECILHAMLGEKHLESLRCVRRA